MMKKSKDLLGLPLIRIADAKELGIIGGFVINPQQQSVDFLLLEQVEGEDLKGIPFGMIEGMGDFAVTVADDNQLINIMKVGLLKELIERKIQILGSKLISRKGMYLGEITECSIHEENGRILGLFYKSKEGEETSIQAEDILTIGEKVVIIKDTPKEEPRPEREVPREEKKDVVEELYLEEEKDQEEEKVLEEEEKIQEVVVEEEREIEEQVEEKEGKEERIKENLNKVIDGTEDTKEKVQEILRERGADVKEERVIIDKEEDSKKEESPAMDLKKPQETKRETTPRVEKPSDPARSIIERKRKELVGKTLIKDIKTDDGKMVARADTVITDEIYDKVQTMGYEVFIELATSVKD